MALNIFGLQGTTYDVKLQEQRTKVLEEFPTNALDCVTLDETMKRILDKEASESKNVLAGLGNSYYLTAIREHKSYLDTIFADNNCRNKIENLRAKTTAITLTNEQIKAEQSVLPENVKEQNNYIILGSVVLLVGMIIILKK